MKPHEQKKEYRDRLFSMRQIRDCVAGSDFIKRAGELYLSMPSGMQTDGLVNFGNTVNSGNFLGSAGDIALSPHYHGNKAYSAYLQRARFPDMTRATMKGLVGVATQKAPIVDLPDNIDYLHTIATIDGNSIFDLFEHALSEVIQVGRIALVLDIRSDNSFYIAEYASESYINWDFAVIDGRRMQTYAEFESIIIKEDGEEIKHSLTYSLELDENNKIVCVVRTFEDENKIDDFLLTYQGKTFDFLPIVNINAETQNNSPIMSTMPLLGISDCAIDYYRHSADLNLNHFMSCNQTPVFVGVDADDMPKKLGSTVAICLGNDNAKAFYLSAKSDSLEEVREYMQSVIIEAVHYGSNILGPVKRAAESAEALSLRQANSGATLLTIVKSVGVGINRVLNLTQRALTGKENNETFFQPNTDFSEVTMTAQQISALLNTWMSGGISHLSFLENMQNAGLIGERTLEDEQKLIDDEGVTVS